MYRKVIVPLDGSEEAEKVVPILRDILTPGGEVVLLRVVVAMEARAGGEHDPVFDEEMQESEKTKALEYLHRAGGDLVADALRWRSEAVVSKSVADGISSVAAQEGADLIAMYTRDRKGLGGLIRKSVVGKVQRNSPVEVRVFKPREVSWRSGEQVSGQDETHLIMDTLRGVEVFKALSDEQMEMLAGLADIARFQSQDVLGTSGDLGDFLFIIRLGELRLTANSAIGEITVRIAGPGEIFPMAALVGLGKLITSAIALTDIEVVRIPRSKLVALFSRQPAIGLSVYAHIAFAFSSRYAKTLSLLTLSTEEALRADLDRSEARPQ